MKIVDAAIADRTRFRVKVHQTEDLGGAKGAVRGATLGVIVGAIIVGPAGAVVGGAAAGVLNGVHNRLHDVGIDDKFMRQVTHELDHGKSALFVLYEGNWAGSIGMIEQAIATDKALLISSTMPPEKAAALKALVDPTVEASVAPSRGGLRGGGPRRRRAAAEEAPPRRPPPAEAAAPVASRRRPHPAGGRRPKASAALAAAGITTMPRSPTPTSPKSGTLSTQRTWCRPRMSGRGRCRPAMPRGDWQGLMKYNKRTSEPAHRRRAKSKAKATPPDDLTQLNGIGPRISSILSDGGVTTYDELEHTDPSEPRKIIAPGGALPPSSLDTLADPGLVRGPRRLVRSSRPTTTASSSVRGRRLDAAAAPLDTGPRPSRCREGLVVDLASEDHRGHLDVRWRPNGRRPDLVCQPT